MAAAAKSLEIFGFAANARLARSAQQSNCMVVFFIVFLCKTAHSRFSWALKGLIGSDFRFATVFREGFAPTPSDSGGTKVRLAQVAATSVCGARCLHKPSQAIEAGIGEKRSMVSSSSDGCIGFDT